MEMLSRCGKFFRIILIIITIIIFALTVVINFFPRDVGKRLGVYVNSTKGVSARYPVEIEPVGWGFSIWAFIYAFQGLLFVYMIANMFRKNCDDDRLVFSPNFISSLFIGALVLNYILNSAWIFFFDRSVANVYYLSIAAIILWLMFGLLLCALTISYIDLYRETPKLLDMRLDFDLWAVRILAHNGISVYAAWCAVAAPLNSAIALTYVHRISNENSCTVALSVLALEIVVYVALDTFLLDNWTRYTITPHLVLVWALAAIMTKSYVSGKRNSIFVTVLLAVAIAVVIEKIILITVRQRRLMKKSNAYNLEGIGQTSITP